MRATLGAYALLCRFRYQAISLADLELSVRLDSWKSAR